MASFNKMDSQSGHRLLLFEVGDLTCGVEVSAVREIIPGQRATRIPGAPPSVDGLVNVRGDLVTQVDARCLLGKSNGRSGPALLLVFGDRHVALVVDEVTDLVVPEGGDVADRSDLPGVDPGLVRGVGRRGNAAFVILDLDALLSQVMNPREDL